MVNGKKLIKKDDKQRKEDLKHIYKLLIGTYIYKIYLKYTEKERF